MNFSNFIKEKENTEENHYLSILKKVMDWKKKLIDEPIPEPSDYNISTMAICCSLNYKFDKNLLYSILGNLSNNYKNINSVKLGFQNSFEVKILPDNLNKFISLKIFKNGSITLSGVKKFEEGFAAINTLIRILKMYPEIFEGEDLSKLVCNKFDPVLINSNFNVKYNINVNKLYNILLEKYNYFVSFDRDDYQGLKIFYWFNNNQTNKGICCCKKKKCIRGKNRHGNGEGDCVRVCVVVFPTGKILINAAKTMEQIKLVYDFIINLLNENYVEIRQFCIKNVDNIPLIKKYDKTKMKLRKVKILKLNKHI
jgi:TATA-box binding protein (TBP) (component of TFIID and TFIIIB)